MSDVTTDLVDRRFGWLYVLSDSLPDKYGNRRWVVRCRCGAIRRTYERLLLGGVATSCGCHPVDRLLDVILQDS